MRLVLILLFCTGVLSAQELKWQADKATSTVDGDIISVSATARMGGIRTAVKLPPGHRNKISFEAKGEGKIQLAVFTGSGTAYLPPQALSTDAWKPFEMTCYETKAAFNVQIYSLTDGATAFQVRNFRAEQLPDPELADTAVPRIDWEAEKVPGSNGKVVKADGASNGLAVWGKRWYRAAQVPVPLTSRPLYFYVRVKKNTAETMEIVLLNGIQPVAKVSFSGKDNWEWLKIGPVAAMAAYPEVIVNYAGDPKTEIWLDRIAVSTEPELNNPDAPVPAAPDAGLAAVGFTGTPPVLDGKMEDSCWQEAVEIGPFSLNRQGRFAVEQTTVRFSRDAENLYVFWRCEESCLVPEANRLHEFKSNIKDNGNPRIFNDDCVLLLLQPDPASGIAYDLTVNANGALLNARSKGPNYWESRDFSWNSNARVATARGDGFWTVEMAIPWSALGKAPDKDAMWNVIAGRVEKSRNESSAWQSIDTGFHTSPFGQLKFVDKVQGIAAAKVPELVPGKNRLTVNRPVRSDVLVQFGNVPRYFYSDGTEANFELNQSGVMQFQWAFRNPADLSPYYVSPRYKMQSRSVAMEFAPETDVLLNGGSVRSGAALSNGRNTIEMTKPGTLKIGDYTFGVDETWQRQGSSYRTTLLVEDTRIWPNWLKEGVSVNRGGLQQILFRPHGIPGSTVDDYTVYFELPEEYAVEGASGYYNRWKLKTEPVGSVEWNGRKYRRYAVRFLDEVDYNTNIASHHYVAFVFRAPRESKRTDDAVYFHSGSAASSVRELPQKLPVKLLPALNGKQPEKLRIQMWAGWLASMDDLQLRDKLVENFADMGVTENNSHRTSRNQFFTMINFADWNFSCIPYMEQHPGSALVDFKGQKSTKFICSSAILEDADFKAYLDNRMPEWIERRKVSSHVDWDYEHRVLESYISCFCPRCLKNFRELQKITGEVTPELIKSKYYPQWTVFMNRRMADIAGMLRGALRKQLPEVTFSVYSGYQNEETKHFYGVDWSMLADKIDLGCCGYGRPVKDIETTRTALGKTPLMLGTIAYPYDLKEYTSPTFISAATLLRRAADGSAGVLVYAFSTLDGRTFDGISTASRIMADHEEFFLRSERVSGRIEIPGWDRADYEVLSNGKGNLLLLLMNPGKDKRNYRFTQPDGSTQSGEVAPFGAKAFRY